ncbi:MAG: type II toxin-antitoxin system RelE/ParE family toxin [Syntrophomonadaceae bacterium]|nr:type II toxin-antitoxin system RelE/ParE family toxin [Syntrophomonadaceae bacterium]
MTFRNRIKAILHLSIISTCRLLGFNLDLGTLIHKLMVGNYIIFYVISEEDAAVTVVRILYGRRNWASLL